MYMLTINDNKLKIKSFLKDHCTIVGYFLNKIYQWDTFKVEWYITKIVVYDIT